MSAFRPTRWRHGGAILFTFVTLIAAGGYVQMADTPSAHAAVGPLTWSDEFNAGAGTPPNQSKWRYDIGGSGWGNNEMQYYTSSTSNAAHNGQGQLVITARRENPANYQCHYGYCQYTSARLLTSGRFTQTYGRFEAHIKIPRGQGIWPAFWMLGDNIGSVGWPQSGEIDIMENIGREPNTVHGTIHGPGYSGPAGPSSARTIGSPLADAFHTYTIDWEPGAITWYLDGVQYGRKTPADIGGNQWVFDHPFFMIMNVAVGGYWPGYPDGTTQFPQTMMIDWVRVYSYQAGPGERVGQITGFAGKCIDVAGANPNNGTQIQLFTCNGTNAQRITVASDGSLRVLGKCLDVNGWATNDGARVILWDCHGGANQKWTYTAGRDLVGVHSGKCLDVTEANSADWTPLQIWSCHGGANQKWNLP